MQRIGQPLMILLGVILPSMLVTAAGSMTLFNDTGSEAYALRVVFDQPVTITQMGTAFATWHGEEDGSEVVFQDGRLDAWRDFYFYWEPEDAQIVTYEWIQVRSETPFDESPFPSWGFVIPEIGGGGYSHALLIPSMDAMIRTGANSVMLSPALRMESATSSRITTSQEETLDEQLEIMRRLILYLRDAGLQVSIKPNIGILDGTWNALIAPEDPERWFNEYREYLLAYASLAQETGVAALYLTNELESMVTNPQFEPNWRDIIAAIRESFTGELSVNAIINNNFADTTTNRNVWQSEVMRIPFADALDFVGVSFYLPLTGKRDPTVAEIRSAWYENVDGLDMIEALEGIRESYGKPVMISEIAYPCVDGANTAPYMYNLDTPIDEQEQLDLFDAMLQVLSTEADGWIRGVSIWGWFAYPNPEDQMLHLIGEHVRASVQGRPAEQVLTSWFHRLAGKEPPDPEDHDTDHPVVVFDNAHDQELAISEEDAALIEPEHPEWVRLTGLAPYATKSLESGDPLSVALEGCNIYVVAAPGMSLSPAELNELESFVSGGGGLLLIGNAWAAPMTVDSLDISFVPYPLGEKSYLYDFASFEVACTQHAVTKYTSSLVVNWGSTMEVGPDWQVIAKTSEDSWQERTGNSRPSIAEERGPFPILAVREFGEGRVVAISDNQPFSLHGDGFLIRMILDWLTGDASKR